MQRTVHSLTRLCRNTHSARMCVPQTSTSYLRSQVCYMPHLFTSGVTTFQETSANLLPLPHRNSPAETLLMAAPQATCQFFPKVKGHIYCSIYVFCNHLIPEKVLPVSSPIFFFCVNDEVFAWCPPDSTSLLSPVLFTVRFCTVGGFLGTHILLTDEVCSLEYWTTEIIFFQKKSYLASILIITCFFYFSCLISLARTSSKKLD